MTTNRDDMPNESYDLAEEWVNKQLNAQFPPAGTVTGMEQCDCVPVDTRDAQGRRWRLLSVLSQAGGGLTAAYEAR